MSFRPCCVIPSRNHTRTIDLVIAAIRAAGLPVFLIDDASDPPARRILAALHAPGDGVTVFRFDVNQGKGGAVIKGFELAEAAGYSHVIQIDADGQHDTSRLPAFLKLGEQHRQAVICGIPIYDRSVPLGRKIGRYLTHVWVWIETLSFQIRDSMCGFRLYPLAPVLTVLAQDRVGRFMDFDTELLVRLTWRGVPIVNVPVRVVYPAGNTSNFRLVADNWRITKMHTRLVLTMMRRLPRIVANRPPRLDREATHWSGLGERGAYWGLRLLAWSYRCFGRSACRALMLPVVGYFYLTDGKRRRASRSFLEAAFAAGGSPGRGNVVDGLRHFLDFAEKSLETFAAWTGSIDRARIVTDDAAVIETARASGALLIVSHLGNVELSRALLAGEQRAALTVLVHTRHAEHYNRLLRRFQPEAAFNLLQVTEIGPETAILLEERIARGEWVAIAGDRTSVAGNGRGSHAGFLGRSARFSDGPYILAHLLGCPTYLLFCLREGDRYRVRFEPFAERIDLPRRDRAAAIETLARRYASRLEELAKREPFQWYNFFDFWAQ